MKISIYDNNQKLAYNPNTMKNKGVGGTQTIIIEVAKELAKQGHEVMVYIKCNFPNIYDGVKYMQYYDYKSDNEDLLIGFESLPKEHNAKKVFNWSTRVAVEDVVKHKNVDKLIVLSEWHRDRYASELPKELIEKMAVVEPGVSKDFFRETEKWPQSITHLGHPHKGGMDSLMDFAKRLKPKYPHSQIHAYGGGELWGWDNQQYRKLYDNLIRSKVLYHGQAGKKRMAIHLSSNQIFLYPVGNHFQETFCLAILEAMAAGNVIIASDNGNIRNLVGDTGYLISGSTKDYKWHLKAIEATIKLFESSDLMEKLSKIARDRAMCYTWEKTAKTLLSLLS